MRKEESVFDSAFGNFQLEEEEFLDFPRNDSFRKAPVILKKLFESDSKNLDNTQRERFANFLDEFQDVFFEKILAGNCDVVEHSIDVKDSLPIKQVPRRISTVFTRGGFFKLLRI